MNKDIERYFKTQGCTGIANKLYLQLDNQINFKLRNQLEDQLLKRFWLAS